MNAIILTTLCLLSGLIGSTVYAAPLSVEKTDNERKIDLLWSAEVSSLYPPR